MRRQASKPELVKIGVKLGLEKAVERLTVNEVLVLIHQRVDILVAAAKIPGSGQPEKQLFIENMLKVRIVEFMGTHEKLLYRVERPILKPTEIESGGPFMSLSQARAFCERFGYNVVGERDCVEVTR